ncbi:MAG: hypothetical protein ACK53Y_20595, partial [bacterium]
PFGVGGIEDVRRTPVSIKEILKYYLNIQMMTFLFRNKKLHYVTRIILKNHRIFCLSLLD